MSGWDDYLYARISDDEVGLEKGVTRQLAELRELSATRHGRIIGEWSDNDVSATKAPPRPNFEQMLAAVSAPNPTGTPRRIVVVHTSRLWRNRVERGQYIDHLGKLGLTILQKNGPELDLRSAQGRWMADMVGGNDTVESEVKAERVYDAAAERAQEGRANGAVLYGWQRIYEYDSRGRVVGFRDEENHAEADVVREIVDRLLAGESLMAVTADLNRRGVPAPGAGQNWRRKQRAKGQPEGGGLWGKTSVKKMAMRHANVGLRIYHRGRPDQALLPAAWPKIVDPDRHDRVVALLSDPSRVIERPGSRQHLLTWGIGECGYEGCGAHLRVALRGGSKWGKKSLLYLCDAKGHVGRNEATVDAMVEAWMVALLRRPDVADLLTGSSARVSELLARVETLRTRLAAAANDYADGHIESAQLRIITGRLKPQLAEAEAEVRAHRPSPHIELVMSTIGDLAEQRWNAMGVTQKRAIMHAFGVRVIILPTRKGPGFDPDSVLIVPNRRSD